MNAWNQSINLSHDKTIPVCCTQTVGWMGQLLYRKDVIYKRTSAVLDQTDQMLDKNRLPKLEKYTAIEQK